MNNEVSGKTMGNVRKNRYIKLRIIQYQNQNIILQSFSQNIYSNRNEKILMKKNVYLGLSIIELSKILMYEFWYDHVKPNYGEKAKLC